jgi:hypothetical protein
LNRVLTVNGLTFTNTFLDVEAGKLNPSGNFNSCFGNGAGKSTTTGGNNSFYGSGSGNGNQSCESVSTWRDYAPSPNPPEGFRLPV